MRERTARKVCPRCNLNFSTSPVQKSLCLACEEDQADKDRYWEDERFSMFEPTRLGRYRPPS